MIPIIFLELAARGIDLIARGAVYIHDQLQDKITVKTTEIYFDPGKASVEDWLFGKFPRANGIYTVSFGNVASEIEVQAVGDDQGEIHWEYRKVGLDSWWPLPEDKINTLAWISFKPLSPTPQG